MRLTALATVVALYACGSAVEPADDCLRRTGQSFEPALDVAVTGGGSPSISWSAPHCAISSLVVEHANICSPDPLGGGTVCGPLMAWGIASATGSDVETRINGCYRSERATIRSPVAYGTVPDSAFQRFPPQTLRSPTNLRLTLCMPQRDARFGPPYIRLVVPFPGPRTAPRSN